MTPIPGSQPDNEKGDIARILFYMAVRYEGDDGNPDLELIDDVNTDALTVAGKGYHGKLSSLLEWNKIDPVDNFEINRNNIIYSYQKNRNPFIDHPEFADCIWGDTDDKNLCSCLSVYPNPARDYLTIVWSGTSQITGKLYSLNGVCAKEFHVNGVLTIAITDIAAGMYILKVTDEYSNFSKKVIVLNK